MLVVHGVWAYGVACLWAEDSELPRTVSRQPGRVSRAPRVHPYACDTERLAGVVAELPGVMGELGGGGGGGFLGLGVGADSGRPGGAGEVGWGRRGGGGVGGVAGAGVGI